MKKIICICICIFLSSGCGKLPNHGSTVNTVGDKKESEVVLTPTQTSKTALELSKAPAPTPEPSKTAPPLSDSVASSDLISCHWYFPAINVSNSVAYWALNAGCYVAIAVICAALYRLAIPAEDYIIDYEVDINAGYVDLPFEEVSKRGYRICNIAYEDIISYTWHIFKKVTRRHFYQDRETKEELKRIPIIINYNHKAYWLGKFECSHLYKPKPEPSQ